MPQYPWLITDDLDISKTVDKINAMVTLGVPYTQFELEKAVYLLKNQAKEIENNLRQDPEFVKNYGTAQIENKEIVALIAYLQRLGTDIKAESAE
jgi:cytochrome c oxidase cbb3-type subunit I/II